MRFTMICRRPHTHCVPLVLGLFLAILATGPAPAQEIDIQLIIPPGAGSAPLDLPPGALVAGIYGPFHGSLNLVTGVYKPGPSFWQIGSDSAILHVQFPGQPTLGLRYHWVVGSPVPDGSVIAMTDPGHGQWAPWEISDSPSNPIEMVAGHVEPLAYRVAAPPEAPLSILTGELDGDTGNSESSTTTSDVVVTIDDIELDSAGLDAGDLFVLYRTLEGGIVISELIMRWNESAQSWEIALSSLTDPNPPLFVPFDHGYNRLRIIRWSHFVENTSGTDLWINDVQIARLATPPRDDLFPETIEATLDGQENTTANLRMIFEGLVTRSSEELVARHDLLLEDGFTTLSPTWQIQGDASALMLSPQQLPGPGNQIEIDLDRLSGGATPALRMSNLRTTLESLPATSPLDPAAYGFRFWIDPSAVNLPVGTVLDLVQGYRPGVGIVFKIRLEGTASGLRIALRGRQDDGTFRSVDLPLTGPGHRIDGLLRNAVAPGGSEGWAELWVDGIPAVRLTGLANHDQQIENLHFGARGTPAGATGTLVLDELEAWRFD